MDELQDQIKTARAAGYSDDDIIKHLSGTDPRVKTALDAGYSGADILGHLQAASQQTTTQTTTQQQQSEQPGAIRRFIDRTPLAPLVRHAEQVVPNFQSGNYMGAAKDLAGISSMGISDLPDMAMAEARRVGGHLQQASNAPTGVDALKHSLYALPLVGGMAEQAGQDYNDQNYAGLLGTGASMLLPSGDIPAVGRAGKVAKTASKGFAEGVKSGYKPVTPGSLAVEGAGVAAHLAGQHHLGAALNAAGVVVPAVRAGVQGAREALASNGALPVQTSRGTFRAPGPVQYEAPPVHAEYPAPDLQVEQPTGGHQSPQQYAGPPGPAPVEPMPDLAYPMKYAGPEGPGPVEKAPGGYWGGGYRATKPAGPGPVERPEGGTWPKGYKATAAPQQTPQTAPAATSSSNPVQPASTGPTIAGNKGDLVIPQHYNGHSNVGAAYALDQKLIRERIPQTMNPDSLTVNQVNQWRTELGHSKLRPADEAIRLEQLKKTLKTMRRK